MKKGTERGHIHGERDERRKEKTTDETEEKENGGREEGKRSEGREGAKNFAGAKFAAKISVRNRARLHRNPRGCMKHSL